MNKLFLALNRYAPAIYLGPVICWFLFYSLLQFSLFYPLIFFFFIFNITAFCIFEMKLSLRLQLFILGCLSLLFSAILGFKDIGLCICFFLVFLLDLLFHVYLSVAKNIPISIGFIFLGSLLFLSSFYPARIQQFIQSLSLLLILSFIFAQAQIQLNKETDSSVQFLFLSSSQKLSYLFLIIQGSFLVFHVFVMKGLTIFSNFVFTCVSWVTHVVFRLLGFVFSLLINLIQHIIRFVLLFQATPTSKPVVTSSTQTIQQLVESTQSLNPLFQFILVLGCIALVFIFILFIFRFLIKLISQTKHSSSSSTFKKESSTSTKEKRSSFKTKLVKWAHFEKVSALRKKYYQHVNLKIKEGVDYLPQDTPYDYLKKVNEQNLDEEFTKLTKDYVKHRYTP